MSSLRDARKACIKCLFDIHEYPKFRRKSLEYYDFDANNIKDDVVGVGVSKIGGEEHLVILLIKENRYINRLIYILEREPPMYLVIPYLMK